MHIEESFICGKHTAADCEDGIVCTPNFVAVIDGSTSKTPLRLDPTMKNGRFAMLLIHIRHTATSRSLRTAHAVSAACHAHPRSTVF